MAPRPTGSDRNWSNMFKGSMLGWQKIPESSLRAMFAYGSTGRINHNCGGWKESKLLTPTHVFIWSVWQVHTSLSLSHDTPVWDLFNWRLLWEVFSCQSLRLEGWQPFSGLSGPQAIRSPHGALWSQSVPCFAGHPLTLPAFPWGPVLTLLLSLSACLVSGPKFTYRV